MLAISSGPKGVSVHIDNSVNITAYKNTELALRVTTDINNENIFYTDNNGFQVWESQSFSNFSWHSKIILQTLRFHNFSQYFQNIILGILYFIVLTKI